MMMMMMMMMMMIIIIIINDSCNLQNIKRHILSVFKFVVS